MKREQAVRILRRHRAALQSRGAWHAALFGSTARGTARAKSDLDILIDVDPASRMGMFAYAGLKRYIAELLNAPVDVVDRKPLREAVRRSAERDAIHAF